MSAKPIQTTVPSDVAEIIERMAREQMIPKSAVVRQLLVKRVRESKGDNQPGVAL
ncbi:MAG: ribbon-helix-helix protein, CopG family [Candidatus Limnocylindrus sp.]|jgi:hypothetical protein